MNQPEVTLWRAVLCQALRDLTNPSDREAQENALRWIFEASADYVWVCEGAGFDPSLFRRHVLEGLFLNRWLKTQNLNVSDLASLLESERPLRTVAEACRHVRKAREMFCEVMPLQELKKNLEALTYEDCSSLCSALIKEKCYE